MKKNIYQIIIFVLLIILLGYIFYKKELFSSPSESPNPSPSDKSVETTNSPSEENENENNERQLDVKALQDRINEATIKAI